MSYDDKALERVRAATPAAPAPQPSLSDILAAKRPEIEAAWQDAGAPAPEAATPPRQLAARMDGDAARYREQADRASQAANVVALNYAAGRSDGLLAAASDVITVLAPAWDALAARDAESAAEAQDWARRCADALAERDEARDEYEAMRARFAGMHPPCPGGCGCAIGTDDADARECACDGPCCETSASVAAERDELRAAHDQMAGHLNAISHVIARHEGEELNAVTAFAEVVATFGEPRKGGAPR